jgi:hypothetical protein
MVRVFFVRLHRGLEFNADRALLAIPLDVPAPGVSAS